MRQVYPDLFVGTTLDLPKAIPTVNLSRVRHYQHQGWGMSKFEDHRFDPTYLIFENGTFLSVNWVDGRAELFNYQDQGVPICRKILDFLDAHKSRQRLIVCDQGISRSPAIAALYLAKREKCLPNSPLEAFETYRLFDPKAQFSDGIKEFLTTHWERIQ